MSDIEFTAAAERQAMRREVRRRRRALTPAQQRRAAMTLRQLLVRQPLFQRSRHIALYLPNDGEIDPRPLLQFAQARGKRCYLPVLHPNRPGVLWFLPFGAETKLQRNRYGIGEPVVGRARRRKAEALDLVLLPLVAFDRTGGRLGMGAGFYDRSFAFKAKHSRHSPVLLGLAHSCQEVGEVPMQAWDIPLGAIATERGIVATSRISAGRDFLGRDLAGNRLGK